MLALLGGQLFFLGGQPPGQLGEFPVAQFGGAGEVIGAFGLLDLPAELFQLGA